MAALSILVVMMMGYLLGGVALASLSYRDLDTMAGDDGESYWRAVVWLVLLWPKALYDICHQARDK